jgi:hypothetical protein
LADIVVRLVDSGHRIVDARILGHGQAKEGAGFLGPDLHTVVRIRIVDLLFVQGQDRG